MFCYVRMEFAENADARCKSVPYKWHGSHSGNLITLCHTFSLIGFGLVQFQNETVVRIFHFSYRAHTCILCGELRFFYVIGGAVIKFW